jgi:hypothetical protein
MTNSPPPFTYQDYRHILTSALTSGYRFVEFPALSHYRDTDTSQSICLLRHDCDNDITAALKMAEVEHESGVKSTYFMMLRSAMYNLLSPANASMVREIIGLGHWIGLHFDESYYADADTDAITEYVERERGWLSTEFNVPVDVVSFHQPGIRVLENQIKLKCLNTYDKHDFRDTYYLSDSNTVWREGSPSLFFAERRHPRLQLLIHPEWWTEAEETILQKWNRMLRHNFDLMQHNLLTRERAYHWHQQIEFVLPDEDQDESAGG